MVRTSGPQVYNPIDLTLLALGSTAGVRLIERRLMLGHFAHPLREDQ
jgi:hypothetical protein